MTKSNKASITITLTDDDLRLMVENHLLREDEISDRSKVALVVRKLLDHALGLPEKPWHDWDDWAKGLE